MLLAQLIAGLLHSGEIRLVIACPGWSRETIRRFLLDSGIVVDRIEFLCTSVPYSIGLARKRRNVSPAADRWARRWRTAIESISAARSRASTRAWRRIMVARNPAEASLALGLAGPSIALEAALTLAARVVRAAGRGVRAAFTVAWRLLSKLGVDRLVERLRAAIRSPLAVPSIQTWYGEILADEFRLLKRLMESRDDVRSWLCPTAFWPELCDVEVPMVVCVPDLTPVELPIGFSVHPEMLQTVQRVQRTVRLARRISVYSSEVRDHQLVERLGVDPGKIRVIPHGATSFASLVSVTGTGDDRAASLEFCRDLVWGAIMRTSAHPTPIFRGAREWRFLLFPSQFRPNKNILGLLDAYEVLLRRHLIPEKLVLTAAPVPELREQVARRGLGNEVVFVPGLTDQELAAFYRLATLSITPSLAEGACPFMVVESLSLGTPVLVSDIPVADELITDPGLKALMTFDPYRREHMVERIRWAVGHRAQLLEAQLPLWERLSQRTWAVAATEYVDCLEDARRSWSSERLARPASAC
jgi:glycosyltransferase involved in cell wall biosynthesis